MTLILLYKYAKKFHSSFPPAFIPTFWTLNPNSVSVIELVNTVLPRVMCVSLKWFVNKYGFNSVYFIWWCACIKTPHLVRAQPDAYKWMLFTCFGLEAIWPSQLDNLLVVTKVQTELVPLNEESNISMLPCLLLYRICCSNVPAWVLLIAIEIDVTEII